MRARDRSVKVIQYGSQMLVGFYSSKFTVETVTALKATRRAASTSRKAFWLLKSFNNIAVITKTITTYNFADDKNFVNGFDLIEQFALVIYFFYENVVFLARHNLVSFGEEVLDFPCNTSWFVGDAACFCSTTIRFYSKFRDLIQARMELQRYSKHHSATAIGQDSRYHLLSSSQCIDKKIYDKAALVSNVNVKGEFSNTCSNFNSENEEDSALMVLRLEQELKEKTDALTGCLLPLSIVS